MFRHSIQFSAPFLSGFQRQLYGGYSDFSPKSVCRPQQNEAHYNEMYIDLERGRIILAVTPVIAS